MIQAPTKPGKMGFTKEGNTAMESFVLTLADMLLPLGDDGFDPFDEAWKDDPVGWCESAFHETYTSEQKAILLSIRDNEETIGKSATGVGKTHLAARAACWILFCFRGSQVYCIAAPPLSNLELLLWAQIEALMSKAPGLFKGMGTSGLQVKAGDLWWIQGLTIPNEGTYESKVSKFSGKHAPTLFFIFDEADGIPGFVFEGVEGCTSGGLTRKLYLFNPKAERGTVYQKEKNREAYVIPITAINHPNVVTGENIYPGAVDREKTVRRLLEWSHPLKSGEPKTGDVFEVPDFLVGCTARSRDGQRILGPLEPGWRIATIPSLMYMVFARYPAQSETKLISNVWYEEARDRYDQWVAEYGVHGPTGVKPVLGLDIGVSVDPSVLTIRAGGFVYPQLAWPGEGDPAHSVKKASEYFKEYGCRMAFPDAGGVGAGAPAHFTRLGCPVTGVVGSQASTILTELGKFRNIRDQNLWAVREWLRTDPLAMLPPGEELEEELLFPVYEIVKDIILITTKDEFKLEFKRSCDHLDSLALTFTPEEAKKSSKVHSW